MVEASLYRFIQITIQGLVWTEEKKKKKEMII